ncbi:MAG TPA: cytochrome c oxidase subunit 3 [Burkholderiales bacterium]|nr:cytochrome c oxidase subunit 3 [Burkholderiales bacterium]
MSEERLPSRHIVDAAKLPSYAFGHRSLMWWGTWGMMAIEGSVFALASVAYFYVRSRVDEWPPAALPPDLTWGTFNMLLMLASLIPNHIAKRAAEREDLLRVRRWLWICCTFSVGFLVLRALEFTALNVSWDTNAYGSAVWMLLGLHTFHVLTDFWDSVVLALLMTSDRIEGKRYVDVSESGMYWYFVVVAYLPIYSIVYFGARVL